MKTFSFRGLLQRDGWIENPVVTVDANGIIAEISSNASINADIRIDGFALPGFQNAHSHAFQYGMAGLAEVHTAGRTSDDFWSWREAMYSLALSVDPDQMEAIATMVYSEMVRQGYTNVAEFHYVHHDKDGKRYSNLAEMGSRLIAAAAKAKINITLIPIFYQKGGFGKEPTDRQRRFISPDIDAYLQLFEASEKACRDYSGANLGVGVHSLRGVEPSDVIELAKSGPQDVPFHIHISEQLQEVEDAVAYLKMRPVEWLLENVELNDRFHLVHATHLTESERRGLATSNAHVVLCPSTEGNLGDGIFPLRSYQSEGGKWSIGTDSHVGLNPLEELRILDYGQRLTTHKRNTFTSETEGDSGMYAITMATLSGRKSVNNTQEEFFAPGEPFNAAIIEATSPLLATSSPTYRTSTILYSSDATGQWGTVVNGDIIVERGRHHAGEEIVEEFAKVMRALGSRTSS
ncbi:MAG: formimidoylglutamate deiminase [Candidatus Kapaibacterium sp.]